MLPPEIARQIERALRQLAYGSIQLIVHDSRVVRIERVERIRLTGPPEVAHTMRGRPTASTEVCAEEREELP